MNSLEPPWILRLAALALLVLALPATASAAGGALDPAFGSAGKVLVDFGYANEGAASVGVQPDGRIVTAGNIYRDFQWDFAFSRHNADGSLDTTFGGDGKVVTDFGGDEDAHDLAVQGDGKILVVGAYSSLGRNDDIRFGLARYNADGSLDVGFGVGGRVETDFPTDVERANAVAVQPDGKIVVVGEALDFLNWNFAVARYLPDGTLDSSFGSGGKVVTDFRSPYPDVARDVAVQADGKIVVAGSTGDVSDFALARYNADGTLDAGFGSGGLLASDLGSSGDEAVAVAIQPDGKIIAAGNFAGAGAEATGWGDFALARYAASGTLDASFGTGGVVRTDFNARRDTAYAMAIDWSGRIVIGGTVETDATYPNDFALARYLPTGALDAGFGSGGKVTTDFASTGERIAAVAPEADGDIVAAGYSGTATNSDFALARYLADRDPDTDGDGIVDNQDPDTVAVVVSALPDSAFSTGEHAKPFLNKLDEIEAMIAAGDLDGARTELQNLRRKVDGCGATADSNDWIVDCAAQLEVRALIDDLLAHLGP